MLAKMTGLLRKRRSPFIGFLIAPAVPLLILTFITIVVTWKIPEIIWGASLILPISYIVSFLIGGPSVYILYLIKKTCWWHYILAGGIASFVPIFVILIYPLLIHYSSPFATWVPAHTSLALLMASSGVIVAAAFWAITRPDLASGN